VFISSICQCASTNGNFGKPPAVGPTAFGFAQGRLSHNAVYECMVRSLTLSRSFHFPLWLLASVEG